MVGVQLKGRASCYIGRILLKLEALSWLVEGAKVEEPPYNEGASIFMEVPPNVEERYIYLEDVNALKEGAILVLEGATFGGHHFFVQVKAKFGGGASLGPCFCQSHPSH